MARSNLDVSKSEYNTGLDSISDCYTEDSDMHFVCYFLLEKNAFLHLIKFIMYLKSCY